MIPVSRLPGPARQVSLYAPGENASLRVADSADLFVRLVGHDRDVLVVGRADSVLLKLLEHARCRVVVHDPALADAVPTGKADVVLVVDPLETIEDPLGRLLEAKQCLRDGGHLVLSAGNATHARARLALLFGRVPAEGRSWALDLSGLETLLRSANLAIGALERETAPVEVDEDEAQRWGVPARLLERLAEDEDAATTRFVVAAVAVPWSGAHWVYQRLRQLSEEAERALRQAREARQDLDGVQEHLGELLRVQEDAARVERELRSHVLHLHAQLEARDAELHQARLALEAAHPPRWYCWLRRSWIGKGYRAARAIYRRLRG